MGAPIIHDVLEQPITTLLILVLVGVFIHIKNRGWDYGDVGISYDRIFTEKQYWRAVSASLSHISWLHLLFNVSGLWSFGRAEQLGVVLYLKYTFLLLLLSMVVVMLLYWVLISRFGRAEYRRQVAVGYSCVLFGWMSIISQLSASRFITILGLKLPLDLAPFGSLLLTQLIVPRASLLGHLSGIIVGYLISWHVFDWIDGLILMWLFIWSVIAVVASLKVNSSFSINFIRLESDHDFQRQGRNITMMNGVLVSQSGGRDGRGTHASAGGGV